MPIHFENVLTNRATLFHLAVKELFRSFITLNCRVSLKYHFEFTDNIMWVKVLKPFLKLQFQTIQDSTLNYGVLILWSEVKNSLHKYHQLQASHPAVHPTHRS